MRFVRAPKTVGTGLMLSSLLVAALVAPAAIAAEGPEVPEDMKEAKVERSAYWNADQSNYANNTATEQFPPEAVCLVQPQACFFPEGDKDPTGGLGQKGNETLSTVDQTERELLASIAEQDESTEPADPVPPDSHPVSVAFGQPNYRSAIEFVLPSVPEGQQLDQFTMVLTQGQPTYDNESPAFRQAVLAALTCASENPDTPVIGRCTQEEFEKIPTRELNPDAPLNVEVCPIVGTWKKGTSQDEDTLPEVDCLYTAAGTPVPFEGGTVWVFDLTFMAQAWYDGLIEPNGILMRPGAAENFAYGDPETTYSKQVTFQPGVRIATATSEEMTFEAPPSAPPPSSSMGGDFGSTSSSGSTDFFATPPSSSSTGSGSVPIPDTSGEQPTVAEPATEQPAVAGEETETLAAGTPLGQPVTPWWLWLLAVPFLGGAWMMTRALEEQAVAVTERSGAMTRLLERRGAASAPDLVTG